MELLASSQSRIMGCIYALVLNMQDTEEVYQQTCLVMWQKFDSFDPGTDFAKWACSVAYLAVMEFFRKKRNRRVRFSDEFLADFAIWGPMPREDDSHRMRALAGCLEALRERDRELITLRYGGEAAVGGIAQQLGRTVQSVSNSLGRIRATLMECIQRTLAAEGYR